MVSRVRLHPKKSGDPRPYRFEMRFEFPGEGAALTVEMMLTAKQAAVFDDGIREHPRQVVNLVSRVMGLWRNPNVGREILAGISCEDPESAFGVSEAWG